VDAGEGRQRWRGRFGVGRLGIVDKGDAVARCDMLHPVRQAGIGAQSHSDSIQIETQNIAHFDGGAGVVPVMWPLQGGPFALFAIVNGLEIKSILNKARD
jgi:hypothetical protein